jgi:hypothetical protein
MKMKILKTLIKNKPKQNFMENLSSKSVFKCMVLTMLLAFQLFFSQNLSAQVCSGSPSYATTTVASVSGTGSYDIEVGGTSTFDQIIVTGATAGDNDITGATLNVCFATGYTPVHGDEVKIWDGNVAFTGAFATTTTLGTGWSYVYGTGANVGDISLKYCNASASIAPTGTTNICISSTTTLTVTASPATGTWSSDNALIASVSSGGVVTGVAAGSTIIKYTITAAGCSDVVATKNITVNPTPNVTQPSSQGPLCNNTMSSAITFATTTMGAGTVTYTWTNDKPSIGLPASGTGDIAAFTVSNTNTTMPSVATIIVTPIYTDNGVPCSGPTKTFTITVQPASNGSITGAANEEICAGSTASINTTIAGTLNMKGILNVAAETATPGVFGTPVATSPYTVNSNAYAFLIPASLLPNTSSTTKKYKISWASLKDADSCNAFPLTGSVVITVFPLPVITASGPSSDVCPGTPIRFNVFETNSVGGTFNWVAINKSNVTIGSGNNINYGSNAINITSGISCTDNDTVTFTFTPVGPITLNCIGNQITRVVNVRDTIKPTFTAPRDTILYKNASCFADTTVSSTRNATNVSDNCSLFIGTNPLPPFNNIFIRPQYTDAVVAGCQGSYVITRTWTLVDKCGNTATPQTQTITVRDTLAPTFTRPVNITLYKNAMCIADTSVTGAGDVTNEADNCSTGIQAKYTDAVVQGCQGSFVITRTWTLVDSCGNAAASQMQTITVSDTTKPTFTRPVNITLYKNAMCTADTSVTGAGDVTNEADNCSTGIQAKYTDAVVKGCQGSFVITRTWTLVDSCGNAAASQMQTITVSDTTKPTFTRPANITLYKNAMCIADTSVTGAGDVTNEADNCSTGIQAKYTSTVVQGCQGSFVITRTWTLVDSCGNAAPSQIQTITVSDTTRPVVTPPTTTDIECATALPAAVTTITGFNTLLGAAASDNCTTTSSLTVSSIDVVTTPGSCNGLITRTYTITDACGNVATRNHLFTVTDNTAPVLVAPATQTLNVGAGVNCIVPMPDYRNLVTVTDCNTYTVTQLSPNGIGTDVVGYGGTRTIVIQVTDACGNTSSTSFLLNLVDVTPPTVITKPATVYLNAAGTGSITPAMVNNGSFDNCSATTLVSVSPSSFTCANVGTPVTVILTVKDILNNVATGTATVTVLDTVKPVITTCAPNVTIAKGPLCTNALANYASAVVATDACGIASITQTPIPGTIFAASVSSQVITMIVTDVNNNVSTCTFTLTLRDSTPPTFVGCPVSQTVFTGPGRATCDQTATWTAPTAIDNCQPDLGMVVITSSHMPGATFPLGTTTVSYTAKDAALNTTTCSFVITVVDNTPPVIAGCPGNVNVNTGAGRATCDQTATWTEPTVTDNCSSVASITWTKSHIPGATFPVGVTTVTYTAKDVALNTSLTCTFTVTVVDNTPPVIAGCPSNVNVNTGAGRTTCNQVATWTEPTVTDNCSSVASITWTKSHLPGATFPVGVTTVTYTAKDAALNTSATCTFTVTVVDNTPPVVSGCPSNISINTGSSLTCGQTATWMAPTATDACSGTVTNITNSHAPGATFPVGVTTVTYTFKDAALNTSTCTFTVTVVDNTPPVISLCPGNINVSTGPGRTTCNQTATWSAPTATDACSGAVNNVTVSHAPGSTFPVGVTTVNYTFKDASNNTSTCSFTVTVTDNTPPVFAACPSNTTAATNTAGCKATVTPVAQTVTDNCSATPTLTWTITGATTLSGTGQIGSRVLNLGVNTILYTATDAVGNTATCSYTITVASGLQGAISGEATVAQNTSTTSTITFSGTGGSLPYTFTYTVNGGTSQTVSTTGMNNIVTVPQSNALLGTFNYVITSITDANGCIGTLVSPTTQTVIVVATLNKPDIVISITGGSSSFIVNQQQSYTINIFNSGPGATTAPVVVNIPKRSGFTFSYNSTALSGTFNNNEWTMVDNGGFLTFTSISSLVIPASTGVKRFQLNVTATGAANSTATFSAIAAGGTGGGETPTSNNTGSRTLIIN